MNAIFAGILILVLVFIACIGGALVGSGAGWVVGLVFDDSLKLLATAMGIPTAEPYQLGAILGFVGGFVRASVSTETKSK